MKKPTKAALYKELARLQAELDASKTEVACLKGELETTKAEVSRLKTVLSKVWKSRRTARFWLKDARDEVSNLIISLLRG